MSKHSFKQLHSFLLLWGSQTVSRLGTARMDYADRGHAAVFVLHSAEMPQIRRRPGFLYCQNGWDADQLYPAEETGLQGAG